MEESFQNTLEGTVEAVSGEAPQVGEEVIVTKRVEVNLKPSLCEPYVCERERVCVRVCESV